MTKQSLIILAHHSIRKKEQIYYNKTMVERKPSRTLIYIGLVLLITSTLFGQYLNNEPGFLIIDLSGGFVISALI